MSTKYVCDRCEKQFDSSGDVVSVKFPHISNSAYTSGEFDYFTRDLCDSCVRALHKWLEMK